MNRSTIVIPVFNQEAVTKKCLEALGQGDFEIIVVDDASTDNTPRLLARWAKRVKVVTHSINQGFATSCNHGAAVASGEYLVFLNNDTLPRPGWLDTLVHYAERHPEAAVIGSKLLYPDNTIQHAGVVICQDRYPRHIYTGFPAEHPVVNKSRPFQIVTAASMLVRRSAFGQLGGFDAAFRNGFEDVDFCLRLGEIGHEVHYCAESVLEHLESVSPGRFKHAGRNVGLYRERWFGRVRPDDVHYYLADELMQFTYEGSFPIGVSVSPRLAVISGARRGLELEQMLAESARQIADLRRENIRLSLTAASPNAETTQYDKLRRQIREVVEFETPRNATVVVVSKGDPALLELGDRQAWHFLQTESGVYAGYHPANSAEAIKELEKLQVMGGTHLLIPATSLWWLDYYEEFREHLETRFVRLSTPKEVCALYALPRPQEQKIHAGWPQHAGKSSALASLREKVWADSQGSSL